MAEGAVRPRPTISAQEFFFQGMKPGQGRHGNAIQFEAHIVNVQDTSSPSWETAFDMGRGDPVVFYGGMSRNVTISFMVVSLTKEEHADNYIKLGQLGSLTYPIYKPGTGYNGMHVIFGVGQLIRGIGVITNYSCNWLGEHPWVGEPAKPVVTDVQMSIMILTNFAGNRPEFKDNYEYDYFGTVQGA